MYLHGNWKRSYCYEMEEKSWLFGRSDLHQEILRLQFFKWMVTNENSFKCFCDKKWWSTLERTIRMIISAFIYKKEGEWIFLYNLLLSTFEKYRKKCSNSIHNTKKNNSYPTAPFTTKPNKGVHYRESVQKRTHTIIRQSYVSLYP